MTKRATQFENSMTDRQIAASVRFGRRITATLSDFEEPISGYIAGMDRYNYLVLVPHSDGHIEKLLVHKGNAALIELHDESTIEHEDLRDDLLAIVRPFRRAVMSQFWPDVAARSGDTSPDD